MFEKEIQIDNKQYYLHKQALINGMFWENEKKHLLELKLQKISKV